MTDIQWGYALNQWKPQFDDFVRREEHERALKTMSIAGFTGVELTAASGRWEPFGNPQQLEANFGSLAGFREFLTGCRVDAVPAWYYDPQQRFHETLTPALSPLVAEDVTGIVEKAEWFAAALAELGGTVLSVRAAPSGWDVPADAEDVVERLAACWDAVGRATARHGVRTALHVDFLSWLRRPGTLDQLLAATDPDLVGLVVDTGELTVAGIDPLALLQQHAGRVWHVQFKDAFAVDEAQEYLEPHSEYSVRVRGGAREVPRWFGEPGTDGGLVDFAGLTRALVEAGYTGWVVVESDQSPHPAQSALVAGYLLQRELRPLVEAAAAPAV
ncbi:TIM barrel protein [Modestobacter sp. VKM Ac-2986]|uniref:sugar phosphate isomerase/epimerase family protein n=1 Tax=Modestobacter sp. VKM Ac-2986 TaxID=3004140 RepID=UPI0022AB0923|nr:TIM barrel protein [Modestobacter sp. VKM Ac-2986]MCZ2828824.1 TIM barrel protein [Modestobacter sp. VKM Ac-2986]